MRGLARWHHAAVIASAVLRQNRGMKPRPLRSGIWSVTLALLLWPLAAAAAQGNYPVKPIRWIVPFPPGGSTTIISRLLSQKLTESWGQQVVVDNRGGGNTIIGS